jgi:hypothetical protein
LTQIKPRTGALRILGGEVLAMLTVEKIVNATRPWYERSAR